VVVLQDTLFTAEKMSTKNFLGFLVLGFVSGLLLDIS
jgi:hypothetical protein